MIFKKNLCVNIFYFGSIKTAAGRIELEHFEMVTLHATQSVHTHFMQKWKSGKIHFNNTY